MGAQCGRRGAVSPGKENAFFLEIVDVRAGVSRVAVTAEMIRSQGIERYKNNVGGGIVSPLLGENHGIDPESGVECFGPGAVVNLSAGFKNEADLFIRKIDEIDADMRIHLLLPVGGGHQLF